MKFQIPFFLFCVLFCQAVEVFDAYRAIQFDKGNNHFGSLTTVINQVAITLNSTHHLPSVSTFTRYVLICKLDHFIDSWEHFISRTDLVGLVLILPSKFPQKLKPKQIQAFGDFEKYLLFNQTKLALYFVPENSQTDDILKVLQSSGFDDSVYAIVKEKEATVISPVHLINLQGTLLVSSSKNIKAAAATTKTSSSSSTTPTLVIVANYDTFSIIPEFTTSDVGGMSDSNGSGAVCLLELARIFSGLYKNKLGVSELFPKFNLIFLLTAGGRLNYEGSKYWMRRLPLPTFDSIDFVLCLESLLIPTLSSTPSTKNKDHHHNNNNNNKKKLYLHISQKTENLETIRLYKEFQRTAAEMTIPFEIVLKKIDVHALEVPLEHEIFSFKNKLQSATLSYYESGILPQYQRSFDLKSLISSAISNDTKENKGFENLENLRMNIKFISKSLARFIFNSENAGNTEGNNEGKEVDIRIEKALEEVINNNNNNIQNWMKTMRETSRYVPVMKKDSPFIIGMKRFLQQMMDEVSEQDFELKSDTIKFYGNTKVKMEIYMGKSLMFDILLLIPIAIYCFLFYVYFVGWTVAVKNIKQKLQIFQTSSTANKNK